MWKTSLALLISVSAFAFEPYKVIGKDNRKQITAHHSELYKTIGQLVFKNTDSKAWSNCTGTLITPRHVLTNGHCVTDDTKGKPFTYNEPGNYYFYPGRLGKQGAPFGFGRGVKIRTFKKWIEKASVKYDIAVIELDKDMRAPVVEIDFVEHASEIDGLPLYVTGYPGDKPDGTMWEDFGYYQESRDAGQTFYHNVDTMPGSSGSLVRIFEAGKWKAVGIHRGSDKAYFLYDMNVAVTFNREIYDAIQRWTKTEKPAHSSR